MSSLNKNPFFSVVIPLYNKEGYIENTLKSVLNQSFIDFEIIIINDGSKDTSLKKASAINDKRITLYSIKNKGVSYARNYGIHKASAKYIALLDADDVWYSNHLEELHKSILKYPNADLFCNAYEIILNKNIIKTAIYNIINTNTITVIDNYFNASKYSDIALTSAVAFSKKTFNLIGSFNEDIKSGQDTDLWIRFALHKLIVFNPTITVIYNNIIKNSLSKNNYNQDRYKSIKNYIKEENNNPSLKKYLDINRYALAIRCKMNNEVELNKKLKKEICYKNLNFKQRILLKFSKFLLKLTIKFQQFLIDKNIYITSYS